MPATARVWARARGVRGWQTQSLKRQFQTEEHGVSKTTTREGVTGGRWERCGCCLSGCPGKTSWGKDTRAEASGGRTRLGPWRRTTQACDKLPAASGSPTPWAVARQTLLTPRFSRQKHWGGLPGPPPGDLPDPGSEPVSPSAPALQADSLPLSLRGSPTIQAEGRRRTEALRKGGACTPEGQTEAEWLKPPTGGGQITDGPAGENLGLYSYCDEKLPWTGTWNGMV